MILTAEQIKTNELHFFNSGERTMKEYHGDEQIAPEFSPVMSASFAIDILTKSPADALDAFLRKGQKEEKVDWRALAPLVFGSAAHSMFLREADWDADIEVIHEDAWLKKDAKLQRDNAYNLGKYPLLLHEFDRLVAMRKVLETGDLINRLVNPNLGEPEVSLYKRDIEYPSILRKARCDFLPSFDSFWGDKPPFVVDYKTTASLAKWSRQSFDYALAERIAWYYDLIVDYAYTEWEDDSGATHKWERADRPIRFAYVVQEKEPPYNVKMLWVVVGAINGTAGYKVEADWGNHIYDYGKKRIEMAKKLWSESMSANFFPKQAEIEAIQVPFFISNSPEVLPEPKLSKRIGINKKGDPKDLLGGKNK